MRYLGILTCVFILLLSACQRTETRDADMAVLIKSLTNPYWKTFHDGLLDTSQLLGRDVYIQGLTAEDQSEVQLNQCENALLRNPKVMLFSAVNSVNLLPCLQKAHARGIVLVDLDGNVDEKIADSAGIKVAFSVASNNYELGVKAAEYLSDTSGKVLIIEGLSGSEPGLLRVNGFKDNLSDNLEVVASLPGDWDRLKAANITNDVLTRNPDLKIVYAVNDLMALGAAETLRSRGRDDVIVIGIDGIADAVKAINEGRMTASVAQLPYLIAKQGLEKADKHVFSGKEYEFYQYVPVLTLDKEILEAKEEPLLEYVR